MARNRIVAALKAWFAAEGFIETEAAILQVSPGNETHLHGFATELIEPDGTRETRYLHTSPEFAMKKLLAAGEEKIVDFARVFRNRERGPLHAPEFTMVEWYRARAPYEAIMTDCAAILAQTARAAGTEVLTWRGCTADPFAEPERLTVCRRLSPHAGIELVGCLDDRAAFATAAIARGVRVAADDTWSDMFSRVLVEKVEPKLGIGRATLLVRLPDRRGGFGPGKA